MSAQSTSGIAAFRRWLLRIHGAILTLVALGSAVATTIGWMTGTGPFGFMQHNPLVWVGLIQAYLLMTIIAVLLVLGSDQPNARKCNVVGALAHCVPLIAALSSLDAFESMGLSRLSKWLLLSILFGSVLKLLPHCTRIPIARPRTRKCATWLNRLDRDILAPIKTNPLG
jgi:hypothetical protein